MDAKLQSAQRSYDAMLPEREPDGPECDCGETMDMTTYTNAPHYMIWTARCPKCGAKDFYDSRID